MAEVIINKNDIETIVRSYSQQDKSFIIKSFTGDDSKKICAFYINGKECKATFYFKKNSVNIVPIGKNIDECNKLIEFISSKGFSANAEIKQFSFDCNENVIQALLQYIDEECIGLVSYELKNNIYKFAGYNQDILTFTCFPTTGKAMIQGKPFSTYAIIITFLSSLENYTFDQVVEINNNFSGVNTPTSAIRSEMQSKLGNVYSYLDAALLKSISGSLSLLKQKTLSEDYTGCIVGEFKALEGFLKKILVNKYAYTLQKNKTFEMFYKTNGLSMIDQNSKIDTDSKKQLNNLYNIYSNKRNVYLHSTIDPSQTRIIASLKEAQDLSDDILKAIKEAYNIIFK